MGDNAEIASLIILLIMSFAWYPVVKIAEYLNPERGAEIAVFVLLVIFVVYVAIVNILY